MYRMFMFVSLCFMALSQPVFAAGKEEKKYAPMDFSVALDRGKLLAEPSQSAFLKVSLRAPEIEATQDRQPVNVCLVLDVSGSMQGSKIDAAKKGALEAISRLGSQDVISVITYSDSAQVLLPATSAGKINQVREAIGKLKADGATALFAGVSLGASELRKSLETHRVHRLVLLSDGQANRGPQTPEELGRLGTALSKEGIAVSTLGLGNNYNEDLMTQLSQSSDGNTYYVENSADLSRIFKGELGDVLNVYAQKVAVQLDFPENVRPVAVVGRDGRISDNQVVIPLKQIYGGQEKFAMVQVTVLDGKVSEQRQLASAQASFVPFHAKKVQTLQTKLSTTFVKKEAEVVASVNKDVWRDALRMKNSAAVDKALKLSKEGRNKEAADELRSNSSWIMDGVEFTDHSADKELRQLAEEMNQYADDIENRKLDKKKRKTLKTKNYQVQSQQNAYVIKGEDFLDNQGSGATSSTKPKEKGKKTVKPDPKKKKTPKKKEQKPTPQAQQNQQEEQQ